MSKALAQNDRIVLKNRMQDTAAHNLQQLRESGGGLLEREALEGLRLRAIE